MNTVLAVVSVGTFIGRKDRPAVADKNGKMPVFLRSVAGGILPADSLVISGTVAANIGLKAGSTATISVTKIGTQEYPVGSGKQVNRYAYSILDAAAGTSLTNKLLEGISVNDQPTPKAQPEPKVKGEA